MSYWKHPAVNGSGVLRVFLDLFQPPEDAEIHQIDEPSSGQHEIPECDVLRVVASGVGDGGMRKRWFFLFLDRLVIGKDAGEDEEGDEEVKQVVDVHSAKSVVCLSVVGSGLGVVDD